jgi:hypothetical protein
VGWLVQASATAAEAASYSTADIGGVDGARCSSFSSLSHSVYMSKRERERGIRRGAVLVVVLRNTKSISRVVRGGGLLAVDVVLIFSVALQQSSVGRSVYVCVIATGALSQRPPISTSSAPIIN